MDKGVDYYLSEWDGDTEWAPRMRMSQRLDSWGRRPSILLYVIRLVCSHHHHHPYPLQHNLNHKVQYIQGPAEVMPA